MMLRRLFAFCTLLLIATTSPLADEPFGTFSIVAYDSVTDELGVAVQSRAFSVGGAVPWAEAGVGAIATQASTNESFGPLGLEMLRAGRSASEVLAALLESDPGRENRQVGIVDAKGRSAAHTGSSCLAWAGDTTGVGLSVQGNILAGPDVVAGMVRAYNESEGELAERLIAALHAAQAAGGDKRGQQSAAILVVRPSEHYPEYRSRYVELRVEDHPDPINELERVFRMHQASDLLRAHLRYAAHFDTTGNAEGAALERRRVGETLVYTLAQDDADAGTLNSLAWFCAASDMYLEESLQAARRAGRSVVSNGGAR
jgi:uncharacterized Ntn-hydrolase superfamily protein